MIFSRSLFSTKSSLVFVNNEFIPPKSPLLTVLSFLIPIVGIVLYFVLKEKEAETAKYCLYAGIASIVLGLIII